MKKITLLIITTVFLLGGCALPQQSTKSALELQAIQAKEFDTTKKIGFASVLSVFQDLGYVVNAANLETGLITAKSPTKQEFVPFVGQKMETVVATAFVEEITTGRTKVRINLVKSTQTSSGYGMRGENELPIEDPTVYQSIFTKVQQGVFVRRNVQ